MTSAPVLRRVLLVVAIVLLLLLAWTGIRGALDQRSGIHTTGQTIQTAVQLVYGVLSLLSVVTVFWARRWNPAMLVCWAFALAFAGGLGATAWGGASALVGVIAGLAAGLIGAGIASVLRYGAGNLIHRQEP
ncbi:MAG TPA: hypothetical protein VFP39_06620 [Gemmatimonadales bacterium]|nr:hypothetical protein [Gemmatimonadales bacterium]